ncbi:imm11 family protein [Archangium sp.]|uniref:imm11 family protein n=1 Tax=Archangium sp. TaxID=1872627 RepID=UPI00389B39B9
MSKYYELEDDRYHPGRWHLRSPVDENGQGINPWQFFKGRRLDLQVSIRFPVRPDGVELDFSWAAFSIPVVHARFVQLFERLGVQDVQFIPVQVEGHAGPFFILNTLRTIRCIDDARCAEVQYWKPEDGQPEKVGRYRVVSGLRIDPSKVGDARIFRTWGFFLGLILSEDLKQALEAERFTGTRFVEV